VKKNNPEEITKILVIIAAGEKSKGRDRVADDEERKGR
jgi:hypothetical protein